MLPITAELRQRKLFRRVLLITCPEGLWEVTYNGRGYGFESVDVNGVEVVRRSGWGRMSQRYEFRLGERCVALSVAVPLWCELLPVRDLNFVRLEVDGEIVYEEGREPDRPLPVTSDEWEDE